MNILVVSSFLPYPLFSGGHVRLFNLLKHISKRHSLTLVCEIRGYQSSKDIKELERFCKHIYTFERKKQWSVGNILKTGLSVYPFLLTGHSQPAMKKKIEDLLGREKFDLIHAETFYIMHNIPSVSIPIVLSEHNIEYLVYERFANNASPIFQTLLRIDIKKLKYWEKKYWKNVTKLVAVSEQDRAIMKREDVVVVKNGVDLSKFRHRKSEVSNKEIKILFIGDFKWIQNRDAAMWILKDIWPRANSEVRSQKSELKLWIVGKSIPESIKKMGDNTVLFDENAKDTVELFQKASLLLAPIRVGGGTSFKILEAMASGVPVITSPFGAEGIEVVNNRELIIVETSQEFIQAIKLLTSNPNKYEEISYNARKLIEKEYDWKKIVATLEEVYQSAVLK